MAFQLSKKPTFRFNVTVRVPDDETGELKAFEFLGEFKRLSQPRIDELRRDPPDDAAFIDEIFVAWGGIKDADGNDLTVTPENRTALLAEAGVTPAILRAWMGATYLAQIKN